MGSTITRLAEARILKVRRAPDRPTAHRRRPASPSGSRRRAVIGGGAGPGWRASAIVFATVITDVLLAALAMPQAALVAGAPLAHRAWDGMHSALPALRPPGCRRRPGVLTGAASA
jgi:hypothetical protein